MIIYELRAYIGISKSLYMILFTNMEAAQREAKRLQEHTRVNGVELHGKITPLRPAGDKYAPIAHETINE